MCVSTGNAGSPNACAMTTLAVLWPTPGSSSSAARSRGTSPPCAATSTLAIACRFFALLPREPARADERQDLRAPSSSPSRARRVRAANSAGVTRLTRASVHCADRIDRDEQLERRPRGRAGSPARVVAVEDREDALGALAAGHSSPPAPAPAPAFAPPPRPDASASTSVRASLLPGSRREPGARRRERLVAPAVVREPPRLLEPRLRAVRRERARRVQLVDAVARGVVAVALEQRAAELVVRRRRCRARARRGGGTRARRRRGRRAGATSRPRTGSSRRRPTTCDRP